VSDWWQLPTVPYAVDSALACPWPLERFEKDSFLREKFELTRSKCACANLAMSSVRDVR